MLNQLASHNCSEGFCFHFPEPVKSDWLALLSLLSLFQSFVDIFYLLYLLLYSFFLVWLYIFSPFRWINEGVEINTHLNGIVQKQEWSFFFTFRYPNSETWGQTPGGHFFSLLVHCILVQNSKR